MILRCSSHFAMFFDIRCLFLTVPDISMAFVANFSLDVEKQGPVTFELAWKTEEKFLSDVYVVFRAVEILPVK